MVGEVDTNEMVSKLYCMIIPLSPTIKLQVLLSCFDTFLREVVERICPNIKRI